MWKHSEKTNSQLNNVPGTQASPLRAEILKSLTELNIRVLELLAEQGKSHATCDHDLLLREVSHRWDDLDLEARRRAASCPYLLVDAGLGDPDKWHSPSSRSGLVNTTGFFTVEKSMIVARQVFIYAWYLANSRQFEGRVLLGMSSGCIEAFRSFTVPELLEFAERATNLLCPRWPHLVAFWRNLLIAAKDGEIDALQAAKMQGLPLLAAGVRATTLSTRNPDQAGDTNNTISVRRQIFPCDSGRTLLDELVGGGRAFRRHRSDR
jgi:hypothetical protein